MQRYWTSVFDLVGVPYTNLFVHHLERVDKKRKRWKCFHRKHETKRRRAHKQDAVSKQTLYENRTKEYESGIGLDIGVHEASQTTTTSKTRKQRKKRDKCKCGATTHLNVNSKECPWNKKNLLKKKEINNEIICQPVNEIGEDSVDPTNV